MNGGAENVGPGNVGPFKTVRKYKNITSSPAWWGYLKADERNRLQSILAKAAGYGYLPRSFSTLDELRDGDEKLFFSASYNPFHVLHRLLPNLKMSVITYGNAHTISHYLRMLTLS